MPSLFNQARELRQQRAQAIADARKILDAAEAEGRDLTQEEQNNYDEAFGRGETLRGRIERIEQQATAEGEIDGQQRTAPIHIQDGQQLQNLMANPEQVRQLPDSQIIDERLHQAFGIEADAEAVLAQERRLRTFQRYLPYWITQDFRNFGADEMRALQAELDTAGGYLRPPEMFVNQLIKNIDDMTYIRQWATTFTVTSAESMGVPTLENDPADADWTSELATGSEDSTMSFGKRALHPHPLAKRIKVSKKLMRAVPSAEGFVRERLAYKFGITFEKGALTGSGAQQPLGLFTASNDGISTGRDVSTGNTTTAIQMDGLIEAKYSIKMQYWPRLRWMFHRDGQKQIAKIKDGQGQYLWRESVRVGEPDRLLNLPTFMSEYVPNTFTTGKYVGLLGDFSQYWIVDALTFELQMLMELYAETNQVGLIGRLESDGQPVLEEAFARVTLA